MFPVISYLGLFIQLLYKKDYFVCVISYEQDSDSMLLPAIYRSTISTLLWSAVGIDGFDSLISISSCSVPGLQTPSPPSKSAVVWQGGAAHRQARARPHTPLTPAARGTAPGARARRTARAGVVIRPVHSEIFYPFLPSFSSPPV